MKARSMLLSALASVGIAITVTGCTTTYDAQGRPVQTVTPEGAALGIAAAGLIGYALADDDDDYRHKRHRGHDYHGGYHRGGHHCRY